MRFVPAVLTSDITKALKTRRYYSISIVLFISPKLTRAHELMSS